MPAGPKRLDGWIACDVELELLRYLICRALHRGSKYFARGNHRYLLEQVTELGKILGGLIKSVSAKTSSR